MRSILVIVVSIIVIIFAGVFLFGLNDDTNGTPQTANTANTATTSNSAPTTNDTATPGSASVSIISSSFAPRAITVQRGTTVTWTNNDRLPHTVTGDTEGPNSAQLVFGATYSYTFGTAGTFPYHCTIHGTSMAGTVIVE